MHPIELTLRAQRQLKALPKVGRRRVAECIDRLGSDPAPSEAKRLSADGRIIRLRAGNHRVVYQLVGQRVVVLEIIVTSQERILRVMKEISLARES
jgi:mRNA-degrading endonuclease RelE of RelBE toxin-antitoxin system